MQHARKFLWWAMGSIAIVCAIGIGLVTILFWPRCDRWEEALATDSTGRSVVSRFEACTGLGTTTEQSIDLKSATGGSESTMKYIPNGGMTGCRGKSFSATSDPTVDWSKPGVIHISIGAVSSILEKHDAVGGINITYDIGTVISEVCDH
jgi:hypothetical protein